jgi:S-formylglutathione hydrolase FrmB
MIVKHEIESAHLAGNLLGDPSTRDLYVYVPAGYENSDRRYAVAYLLHGWGLRPIDMIEPGDDELGTAGPMHPLEDILDLGFARRPGGELIVAVVDGYTRHGGGQYVDSPVNGNFEQFAVDEVVPYVDTCFRTIADRDSRAVFGYSSGGFGAWHLGSRHPDVFGAIAMLSADSFFELSLLSLVYKYFNSLYPEGRDPGGVAPTGPSTSVAWSRLTYSHAASYSPNPDNPPHYVDLPVAFPSGRLIPEVWERWLDFDPVVEWPRRADSLRSLRGLLLSAGRRDDWYFHWGHRILHEAWTDAGISHDFREHSGTHESRFYEAHAEAVEWLGETLVTRE